ncbi:MAG: EamA family transporter, partial [Cypionkella sp.]|nr:EamA family transporter [Cypionkella sp.]
MVLSGLSFVGVNGIVRYLGTDLPAAQSAFLRFAFGVLLLAPVLPGLARGMSGQVLRLFAWRGVMHTIAVLFWFYAMARIPVAHATAIGYLNPVLMLIAGA